MKRNYDLLMQEQMKKVEKGTPLLLHSCCAPCSSTCLERLKDTFKVTVLYYNPNIDEDAEYEKRKAEQIRFLQETGWADFLDCDHDAAAFTEMVKGLENEPERGARCYKCYALRLAKMRCVRLQLHRIEYRRRRPIRAPRPRDQQSDIRNDSSKIHCFALPRFLS